MNQPLDKDNNFRIQLLGCPIDNVDLKESIEIIEKAIKKKVPQQYIAINANKIVKMRKDLLLRDALLNSNLNIVDGQPIMWVARLFGHKIKKRFGGLDLIDVLIPLSIKKGYKLFFLGAREEILQKVMKTYKEQYPGFKPCGYRNGYWDKKDENNVVISISKTKPDILFFAMSSPKKEIFLKNNLQKLNIPYVIGVGGAFDIVAGRTKRAPLWIQKIGMEWFFRLAQEPRRMWKRYLIGNILFIWIVIKEFWKSKPGMHS